MSQTPDSEAIVSALLTMAGLSIFDDEKAALVGGFAANRAAVDALYKVPEVRYEVPALTWSSVV
ncbi:MAG: hypothetical protein JWN95_1970 [Frankiales bacterium]|nr:hypothetical protein [Frankiales bacterium]